MKKAGSTGKFLQFFLFVNVFMFFVFICGVNSNVCASYNSFKNSRIVSEKKEEKKGFVFDMKFDKNYSDGDIANYVDLVVRYIKKLAKAELDVNYVDDLFKIYRIVDDEDKYNKYYVKFYVYPNKEDFDDVKKFVKNNLLDNKFSDLFKNFDDKEDFKDYVKKYALKLKRNLKKFILEINSLYIEGSYDKIYDIFKQFNQSYARSDRILSSLSQNLKVMNKIADIKGILKDLSENQFRYKYKSKNILNKYDDDDDDDDYEDEYLKDKDYNYGYSVWKKTIAKFKNNIIKFFEFFEANINEIKDLDYIMFKKTLKTVKFGDSVRIVKREIRKFDGYLEKVREY